jgi:hypothetical protein
MISCGIAAPPLPQENAFAALLRTPQTLPMLQSDKDKSQLLGDFRLWREVFG